MTDLPLDTELALTQAPGPSDAELITAVRSGETAAFGPLFDRHVGAARALARQLTRDPNEADDLVSEAFAKVLTVVQAGGGPDVAFRAYLLTALRRNAYDRTRQNSRVQVTDDLTAYDPGVPFVDPALEGLEKTIVSRAYSSLPERWQTVLWHTEVEGLNPAEVAPLLGLTANGVAALAYRAREGLRQAYLQQHLMGPLETDCQPYSDRLGSYARGGLSKRETAQVEGHLEGCARCRGLVLELTEVSHGMRAVIAPLVLGLAAAGYLSAGALLGTGTAAVGFGHLVSGGSAGAAGSAGTSAAGTAAGTATAGAGAGTSVAGAAAAAGTAAGSTGVAAAAVAGVVGLGAAAAGIAHAGPAAAASGAGGSGLTAASAAGGSSAGGAAATLTISGAAASGGFLSSWVAGAAAVVIGLAGAGVVVAVVGGGGGTAGTVGTAGNGPGATGPIVPGPGTTSSSGSGGAGSTGAGGATPTGTPVGATTSSGAPSAGVPTATSTPTIGPTTTPTRTASPTPTITVTPTTSPTPTATGSPTPTGSPSPTDSGSPSGSPSPSPTDTGPVPEPILVATYTSLGNLVQGRPGVIGFAVTNTGTAASSIVTAEVSLPPGVTYVGLENTGGGFENGGYVAGRLLLARGADEWACTGTVSGASCTHPPLAIGSSTSAYLDVAAAAGSQGDVAPSVTISADGLQPVTISGPSGVQAHGLSARYAAAGPVTVTEVGNALLSCPIAATGCAEARMRTGKRLNNDQWSMTPYDGDNDPTTTASSGATLSLPSGGTVRWAGLYWSGAWTGAATETIKLRTPGESTYRAISADRVDTTASSQFTAFQAYTDVTALVQAAGGGDWWAADPQVVTGTGTYAGWSLVVVADVPGSPNNQVSVFDGMTTIDPSTGRLSFNAAAGPGGPTRIGSVVWEGDAGYFGDSLSLDGTALTPQGGFGDPNNFADSSANGAIGPTLTFGTDVDSFHADVPAGVPVLSVQSTGETLYAGVITISGG